MNEADFIDQQCKQAKSAITATAKAIGHDAVQIIDPRRLTREHPWALLAVAAAAGFVGSKVILSAREPHRPEGPQKHVPRKRIFTVSRVLALSREILRVAGPILNTVWSATLTAGDGHHGNGVHPSQTPAQAPGVDPPNNPSQS